MSLAKFILPFPLLGAKLPDGGIPQASPLARVERLVLPTSMCLARWAASPARTRGPAAVSPLHGGSKSRSRVGSFVLGIGLAFALVLSSNAFAIDPLPFKDRAQEVRFQNLTRQLRCLVCQNQDLADSDADLAKDLRVPHTPDRLGFITSLGLCVLAARAYGLDIVDGVHLDLSGGDEFRATCAQGRALGFDGKTLIHPNQIAAANEVFGPSADAIEHAKRIIAAWQEVERSGAGVAVLDGKLVENLHAAGAERVLAIASAIAAI